MASDFYMEHAAAALTWARRTRATDPARAELFEEVASELVTAANLAARA